MRGGEGLDCVQEPCANARSSSLRADGHAADVEVSVLGHRSDGTDDRVRDLGDPDRTLRKALQDLVRGRGRRAERSWRVECFELGKSCLQRSRDRLRIVFLGKPNGHAALCSVGSIPILFSAPPGKLSNTMVRYPDTLSLLKARALFFRDAKLGPHGGYSDRWVRVETKPIPFYFPNWPSRVAAARLHDLHHIATDYETDWPGEAEIAAWEIASGCARYHAAWILNFGAFGAGLVVAPRRVFRAFLRGRHTKTNLYKSGFDESRLDDITVGMLRDQLGLRAPLPSARATDVWLFLVWCIPSVLAWLLFPFLTIILFWLIVRAKL